MGGNAFPETRRLDKLEYETVMREVVEQFCTRFTRFKPTQGYANKESFGDLDIVFAHKVEAEDLEQWLRKTLGVTEFCFNGGKAKFNKLPAPQMSFKYKGFQVDLVCVPEELFEIAHFYYSYNDLNNLIGSVAKGFGLKLGWDGLSLSLGSESGSFLEKIYLSRDPREIYTFLGYDYDRYLQGFDTLESIFEYVSTSKYFNAEAYAYTALNNKNRVRNKKRKTYRDFLEWLEGREGLPHYTFNPNKLPYLLKIAHSFPEVRLFETMGAMSEELRKATEFSKVLNGRVVNEVTGLTGRELGLFLRSLRSHPKLDRDFWLSASRLTPDDSHVRGEIKEQYKLWKE